MDINVSSLLLYNEVYFIDKHVFIAGFISLVMLLKRYMNGLHFVTGHQNDYVCLAFGN